MILSREREQIDPQKPSANEESLLREVYDSLWNGVEFVDSSVDPEGRNTMK